MHNMIRGSIVVSISACHAVDPGSIPGRGVCTSRGQLGCPRHTQRQTRTQLKQKQVCQQIQAMVFLTITATLPQGIAGDCHCSASYGERPGLHAKLKGAATASSQNPECAT